MKSKYYVSRVHLAQPFSFFFCINKLWIYEIMLANNNKYYQFVIRITLAVCYYTLIILPCSS